MKIGEQDINKVFVVECLRENDLSTGTKIKEHILAQEPNANVRYLNCITKSDFLQHLNEILNAATSDDGFLLFIEVHGSVVGIELGEELVPWAELTTMLQAINERLHMGLVVVFSCCFGVHFYRQTSILGRSPYYVMFGVDNSIYADRLLKMNQVLVDGFYCNDSLIEIETRANIQLNIHDVNLTHLEAGALLIGAFTNYFTEQLSIASLVNRFEKTYKEYRRITPENAMSHSQYKKHYFDFIFRRETLENGFNDIRDKFLMTDLDGTLYERFHVDFDEVYSSLNVEARIKQVYGEIFA
ncbi:hypothetical protein CAG58_15430 [Vibrio sp. V31_P5A7T61]|uniref:hypothetical protein n=1 Tax=unclassified Vibrio TaxID=2614977 RepID=UPI001372528A|nr:MULTISPECIES: hypothetical protein [unclassified Vibrio]NAW63330.1 hypothetical protein [Vibrio sp. V31_P5A7T61]NAX02416.1 hypothetical protein [Vibrio sp. V34_P3A8T189]NAX09404.1 hypothetical protein [Vibrio sp. V40_P2S30T141]NAX62562.1 hypothetical protein [Vibrio sp. V32_P6A28T40]